MVFKLRRTYYKYSMVFIFVLLIWIYWDIWLRYTWDIGTEKLERPMSIPSTEKIVLLWTTMFYDKSLAAWGNLQSTMKECPHKCHFSVEKSLLSISDAVVYHGWPEGLSMRILGFSMYPLPKPVKRRLDQVWVYLMMEPPAAHYDLYSSLDDHYDFNWTMTYRLDSDIPILYGDFERIPTAGEELNLGDTNLINSKSLVAGMISECHRESGRDAYINELKKYIPVDLYGKCGDHYCAKAENCYQKLSRNYKFWLSFENSLCPDYLTEKFFLPLRYGMVPVYMGHPDNLRHAPSGSYINTKDFDSPQSLAKYLTHLNLYPEEYLKFFEWKKEYRLKANTSLLAWCELCTKLHKLPNIESKSYRNIGDWFLRNNTANPVCLEPNFNF